MLFLVFSEALCSSCRVPEWLFKIMFWLGYCNSLMNPIIYSCASQDFQIAFLRLLRCRCRTRRPVTPPGASRYFVYEEPVSFRRKQQGADRLGYQAAQWSHHDVQASLPAVRRTCSDRAIVAGDQVRKARSPGRIDPFENPHQRRINGKDQMTDDGVLLGRKTVWNEISNRPSTEIWTNV